MYGAPSKPPKIHWLCNHPWRRRITHASGQIIRTRRQRTRAPLYDLRGMKSFLRLGEKVERELVLGMVGQFWRPHGGSKVIGPEAFAEFVDPDYAKLAWGFALEATGGCTLLRTETRVQCLSADSKRKFRPYWMIIRPVSGLIRRQILAGIGRAAMAPAPAAP